MLRASSKSEGREVSVQGLLHPDKQKVNVENEEILLNFAESAVRNDESLLAVARNKILDTLGPGALVDAAVLVGNFERMNRISDGCGIALGEMGHMFRGIIQELESTHL